MEVDELHDWVLIELEARLQPNHPLYLHTVTASARFLKARWIPSFANTLFGFSARSMQSQGARQWAEQAPLYSIAVETDSPYLRPEGLNDIDTRKGNSPWLIAKTMTEMAHLRYLPVQVMALASTSNTRRLFRLV